MVQPATASQSELIDEYEKEMCTRAGEEVRLSETNSYMMVSTFPFTPFGPNLEGSTNKTPTRARTERD